MPRSGLTFESIWPEHEDVIRRFELAWTEGSRPDIAAFIPDNVRHSALLLKELVQIDMELRFRAKEQPRLEGYLQQFAELNAERDVLDLLEHELDFRFRSGERPTADELRKRFPQFGTHLESLLQICMERATG